MKKYLKVNKFFFKKKKIKKITLSKTDFKSEKNKKKLT